MLPALESSAHEEKQNHTEKHETAANNKKILLIDDEELIRKTVTAMLTMKGCDIKATDNGYEAAELFEKKSSDFDLVILDMDMPHISGMDTLKLLREVRPDVPVIMISGYRKQSDSFEAIPGPEVQYLPKPFTIEELLAKIAQATSL